MTDSLYKAKDTQVFESIILSAFFGVQKNMGDIEIAKKLGFGPLFIVQKMLVHLHKYLVQFS